VDVPQAAWANGTLSSPVPGWGAGPPEATTPVGAARSSKTDVQGGPIDHITEIRRPHVRVALGETSGRGSE
jgi:hypothetical protein